MNRTELIQYHQQEAQSARQMLAQSDGPGNPDLRQYARDHEDLAEAARVGDYPHPSEQIIGTDV